jgi:hypothetical protein
MIAIVVPTIRSMKPFIKAWSKLIKKHDATLITVIDGDEPYLLIDGVKISKEEVMGEYADLIYNHSSCCRNLGFAYAYKHGYETIISMDDDVTPVGDTIQDHLDALEMRVPISWMKIGSEYTRGFPYGVRDEAEVVLSHGVWTGIPDYDAPSQLINGSHEMMFYKGSIPKGALYPMSAMNVAFKRKLMTYMYQPPMSMGFGRFDDIWSGIGSKWAIDKKGWAVVTGYAVVKHQRASNVFKNLESEAKGIELNELFWKDKQTDPYFKLYAECLVRWREFLNE